MHSRFVPLLLRVDSVANIGLAAALVGFGDRVRDGLGLASGTPMVVLAVGLVLNGLWLWRLAEEPRAVSLRVAGAIDLGFVVLMVVLALSESTAGWAAVACWVLAVAVDAISLGKIVPTFRSGSRTNAAVGV